MFQFDPNMFRTQPAPDNGSSQLASAVAALVSSLNQPEGGKPGETPGAVGGDAGAKPGQIEYGAPKKPMSY